MGTLNEHFDVSEFDEPHGLEYPRVWIPTRLVELGRRLLTLREHPEVPFIIIASGYRSYERNKAVGGDPNSYHMCGMAADIYCPRITSIQMCRALLDYIEEGKIPDGGVSIYKSHVHYDTGPARRW